MLTTANFFRSQENSHGKPKIPFCLRRAAICSPGGKRSSDCMRHSKLYARGDSRGGGRTGGGAISASLLQTVQGAATAAGPFFVLGDAWCILDFCRHLSHQCFGRQRTRSGKTFIVYQRKPDLRHKRRLPVRSSFRNRSAGFICVASVFAQCFP